MMMEIFVLVDCLLDKLLQYIYILFWNFYKKIWCGGDVKKI